MAEAGANQASRVQGSTEPAGGGALADTRRGMLLASIGGMALTVDVPLIRLAGGDFWSVLVVRSGGTVISAVVIWLAYRLMTGRSLKLVPGRGGLIVAALYAVSALTFITAVYNTTTSNLVFILAFNTVFSALLSWIFLKQRPAPATLAAMLAMIVGVALIVWDGISAGHVIGDAAALASAFLMACALTVSRSLRRDMGFTPMIANLVPAVIAVLFIGHARTGLTIDHPVWIVLNGFVVIPLSFWCLATGPKYLSAPEVAMFYLLETILAPVWVWLIFGETPSTISAVGGAIMVVALVAHSIWQIARSRRSALSGMAKRPI